MKKWLFAFCFGVWVGRNQTINIGRTAVYKKIWVEISQLMDRLDLQVKASDYLRSGGNENRGSRPESSS